MGYRTGNGHRTGRRQLLTAAAAAGAAGCAPLELLDAMTPTGDYVARTDMAYAPGRRGRLDVYRPRNTAGPCPVVVFFYGGAWQSGAKEQYRFVAETLTRHGFVVVIPDYRLYPEVRFPAFIEDGAQAVRWTRDAVAGHGGDPGRIHLMGHSAGAHTAAMLALDPRYLAAVGMRSDAIASVVGLAGPYDFLPLQSRNLRAIFEADGLIDRTQPIRFADGTAPPMLLLTGGADTTVSPGNTERLAARIAERGGKVQSAFYPGVNHAGILLALSSAFPGEAQALSEILAFLGKLERPLTPTLSP